MNKWIRENLFGVALYLPFPRQYTSQYMQKANNQWVISVWLCFPICSGDGGSLNY